VLTHAAQIRKGTVITYLARLVGAPAAPQRHHDPGRIPCIDLFRIHRMTHRDGAIGLG
jgi:hypothetical protein